MNLCPRTADRDNPLIESTSITKFKIDVRPLVCKVCDNNGRPPDHPEHLVGDAAISRNIAHPFRPQASRPGRGPDSREHRLEVLSKWTNYVYQMLIYGFC